MAYHIHPFNCKTSGSQPEFLVIDETWCNSPLRISDDSLYIDISSGDLSLQSVWSNNYQSPTPKQSWTIVKNRSRRVHCGSANQVVRGQRFSNGVRSNLPVRPASVKSRHQANKTITGVFISRLDPHSTAKPLEMHIKREASYYC